MLLNVNAVDIQELTEVMSGVLKKHGNYLVSTNTQTKIFNLFTGTTFIQCCNIKRQSSFKGKKKYLRFQLAWHSYCSISLLPDNIPFETVLVPNKRCNDTDSNSVNLITLSSARLICQFVQ